MSGAFNRVRFSSRRGFTLIELLVVIAIIALLVSILMPTLGKAKHAVRLLTCMTNMKTIGNAASMYAGDNKLCVPRDARWYWKTYDEVPEDFNPAEIDDHGSYFFGSRFSPYMGGPEVPWRYEYYRPHLDEVFKNIKAYRCPSFPDKRYQLTYLTNGWNFTDPTKNWTTARPLSNLNRTPSEVGYIMEFNHHAYDLDMDGPRGPNWPYLYGCYDCLGYLKGDGTIFNLDLTFDENGDPNNYIHPTLGLLPGRMIRVDDERHQGRTTLIFFDGHAEKRWLKPKDLPLDMFFVLPNP